MNFLKRIIDMVMSMRFMIGKEKYEFQGKDEQSIMDTVDRFVSSQKAHGVDATTSAAPSIPQPHVASPEPSKALVEPVQKVQSILTEKGFGPAAVAGIMANIDVETGGSFDFQQKQIKGPGYGLFQLDPSGPLPKEYQSWLEKQGREDSARSQIAFMHETVYGDLQDVIGRGNAAKIREVFEKGTAAEAAEVFMKLWERPGVPHWDRRKESAEKFFKSLGGDIG